MKALRQHFRQNGVVRIEGVSTTWKQFQQSAKMSQNAGKTGKSVALTKLEVGKTYTASFEARLIEGSANIWSCLRADSVTVGNKDNFKRDFALTHDWSRYQYTGTITQPADDASWRFIIGYNQIGVIEIRKIKLEMGTLATDWSSAPEDFESDINAVSSDLTSYKVTQANVDKAQTDQITTHTARLGTAEGKISAAERSISTLNSSMATKFSEVAANFTKLNNNVTTAKTDLTARITAEEQARADGDKANADKITALTSRVGNTESSITTLQTSVATANRSVSELSQNLNAKIDNLSVGGRNYLQGSRVISGYWSSSKASQSTGRFAIENNKLCWLSDTDTVNNWKQWQATGYALGQSVADESLNLLGYGDEVTLSLTAENSSSREEELQIIFTRQFVHSSH